MLSAILPFILTNNIAVPAFLKFSGKRISCVHLVEENS